MRSSNRPEVPEPKYNLFELEQTYLNSVADAVALDPNVKSGDPRFVARSYISAFLREAGEELLQENSSAMKKFGSLGLMSVAGMGFGVLAAFIAAHEGNVSIIIGGFMGIGSALTASAVSFGKWSLANDERSATRHVLSTQIGTNRQADPMADGDQAIYERAERNLSRYMANIKNTRAQPTP